MVGGVCSSTCDVGDFLSSGGSVRQRDIAEQHHQQRDGAAELKSTEHLAGTIRLRLPPWA